MKSSKLTLPLILASLTLTSCKTIQDKLVQSGLESILNQKIFVVYEKQSYFTDKLRKEIKGLDYKEVQLKFGSLDEYFDPNYGKEKLENKSIRLIYCVSDQFGLALNIETDFRELKQSFENENMSLEIYLFDRYGLNKY